MKLQLTSKPGRGRPLSPNGPLRIMVRGKVAEVALWRANAEADGIPLSVWMRQQLNRAARKLVDE